ncbi:MAG: hypothetical protein QM733_07085 [Ilumatobacteraceae bacterium]
MNLTKKIGIGAAAAALTVGAGATAFAAGTTSSTRGERGTFACAHLDELEAQQQTHLDLLNGRLHLLQEADDAARAAGHDAAEARIEVRIARTNQRIAKVTERQGKLQSWAAEHCTGDAATATTPG